MTAIPLLGWLHDRILRLRHSAVILSLDENGTLVFILEAIRPKVSFSQVMHEPGLVAQNPTADMAKYGYHISMAASGMHWYVLSNRW